MSSALSEVRADTIEQVLALAEALAQAAVTRYASLASCMRRVGHEELAIVFESLGAEERAQKDAIKGLSVGVSSEGRAVATARWQLPEPFRMDDPLSAALLTPYKAWSTAIQGEERAFAFWSYVASHAPSERVSAKAEEMALAKLALAARLRRARRAAYHAAGRPRPERREEDGVDMAGVRRQLTELQEEAVELLQAGTNRLEALADERSARMVRDVAKQLMAAGWRSRERPARRDPAGAVEAAVGRAAAAGPAGILFEVGGALERVIERCLDLLEHVSADEVVGALQQVADLATAQGTRISDRLFEIAPDLRATLSGHGEFWTLREPAEGSS
jgi:hypothetical protein